MKEYQTYAPQDQQKNGYRTENLQNPAEAYPMTETHYEEQIPQQVPQQNSNPFKNQTQSNPFRK